MNIHNYETYHEKKNHIERVLPYNTYICSIPLDFSEVPIHWHDEFEIIYVKKGCGVISLDFEEHYAEAGDIIIVLPGQLHSISQYENYAMEYENIIFSLEMLISRYSDNLEAEFFSPLITGRILFNHIVERDNPLYYQLSSCLNRADKICASFPKGYELVIKSCLFEFFYIIRSNSEFTPADRTDKNLEKIKEIIKYIEDNFSKPLTVEEVANVSGFSESHFMRFFRKATGKPFINYLNDYRLSMASRMLLSSNDKIIDIATECGYDNLSYFNRIFKKKYQKTPSSYRRNPSEV